MRFRKRVRVSEHKKNKIYRNTNSTCWCLALWEKQSTNKTAQIAGSRTVIKICKPLTPTFATGHEFEPVLSTFHSQHPSSKRYPPISISIFEMSVFKRFHHQTTAYTFIVSLVYTATDPTQRNKPVFTTVTTEDHLHRHDAVSRYVLFETSSRYVTLQVTRTE